MPETESSLELRPSLVTTVTWLLPPGMGFPQLALLNGKSNHLPTSLPNQGTAAHTHGTVMLFYPAP